MKVLEGYKEEIENDIKIDISNVLDVQMRLPAIKHKWASRLISHKIEVDKQNIIIDKAKEAIAEKLQAQNNNTIKNSNIIINTKVNNHEIIRKLKDKRTELEYLIMYLEKIEKILHSTTYDIKNMVDLIKLEQL